METTIHGRGRGDVWLLRGHVGVQRAYMTHMGPGPLTPQAQLHKRVTSVQAQLETDQASLLQDVVGKLEQEYRYWWKRTTQPVRVPQKRCSQQCWLVPQESNKEARGPYSQG